MTLNISEVGRDFRKRLGFTSQDSLKEFYKGSDIDRPIDFNYIDKLNKRLADIVSKVDATVNPVIRQKNLDTFLNDNLNFPYEQIIQNRLLPLMNNQGRKPEDVYFSWMKGHLFSEYFKNSLSIIFSIEHNQIKNIGEDDFTSIETFKRSAKADLEFNFDSRTVRLEMQSGFLNVNDIKQHKWVEAIRKAQSGIVSIVTHIDLFNGAVAFVRLDNLSENDLNWITRTQMEGQLVYNIDASKFSWLLVDTPPKFNDLRVFDNGVAI